MKQIIKNICKILLKNRILSYLAKQYIIRQYIKLNQDNVVRKEAKTPWVCEFRYNVDRCTDYINEVFSDYFSKSGLSIKDIVGKNILEIGPGENLGVALRFLSAGAEKVICVDRFNSLLDEAKQTKIYDRLLSELNEEERERFRRVITTKNGKININSDRLQYLNVTIEKMNTDFQLIQFDFIISRAVLEHVFMIEETMETMDLLLKPGGYMLHEVDFRDHGVFTRYGLPPLTFLSIDQKIWLKMSSNLGAPNRKMLGYYQSFFKEKGYLCDTMFVRLFGSDNSTVKIKSTLEVKINESQIERDRMMIHPSCELTSDMDMVVAAAFYCAKKQK